MLIWHCVKGGDKTRKELRARMPANWQPPKSDTRNVIVPLEKLEEIDKIMRKAPESKRALGD